MEGAVVLQQWEDTVLPQEEIGVPHTASVLPNVFSKYERNIELETSLQDSQLLKGKSITDGGSKGLLG